MASHQRNSESKIKKTSVNGVDSNLKYTQPRQTFQFKLVGITSELREGIYSPAELEQNIQIRPKNKPSVQVTVAPDLVQVKYKKLQKHRSNVIISSTFENICSVFQISSQLRALSFIVHNPDVRNSSLKTVVLMAKKKSWFNIMKKPSDAVLLGDILRKMMSDVRKETHKNHVIDHSMAPEAPPSPAKFRPPRFVPIVKEAPTSEASVSSDDTTTLDLYKYKPCPLKQDKHHV